jgi:hypothetical protein
MKLKYWYKIDHNKQPIPGSNIRRKSKPGASHQWKEIVKPCCDPQDIDCTCGPRYFVQLDGLGNPVDHSLIKRFSYPRMQEGINYHELPWKSVCCPSAEITWEIIDPTLRGYIFKIFVNNVEVLATSNATGSFPLPEPGDTILVEISVNPAGAPSRDQDLIVVINDVAVYDEVVNSDLNTNTYQFTWDGTSQVSVTAVLNIPEDI